MVQEKNHKYYIEKDDDDRTGNNSCVCHIVFAREGSEAGPVYNITGKEILLTNIRSVNKLSPFCVEDKLKEYLQTNLGMYIDTKRSDIILKTETEGVPLDNTRDDEKSSQVNEYIKLVSSNLHNIEFKQCNFDDFGYLKFSYSSSKAQQLPYCFFRTEESYVMQVEVPGFNQADLPNLNFKKMRDQEAFYYVLQGKKKSETPSDLLFDPPIMQFGDVICQTDRLMWAKHFDFEEKYKRKIVDGMLTITWGRKKATSSGEEEID